MTVAQADDDAMNEEKIKKLVLEKRDEVKIVFRTFEGLMSVDLDEFKMMRDG